MKLIAFSLLILSGLIEKLSVKSSSTLSKEMEPLQVAREEGFGSNALLKSMKVHDEIMNLDSLFEVRGSGKKKDKKKKKGHHSSSDDDSETSRRRSASRNTSTNSGNNRNTAGAANNNGNKNKEPTMRQQEVAAGDQFDDGSITVNGPIRRKPLIFPN